MRKHVCDALVISCIDFRFQKHIERWLKEEFQSQQYDRVGLAGGVYDFYSILRQVEISNNLHKIHKVVLFNHEDCGAYGADGSFEKHQRDLIEAERKIEAIFPHLDVETYFLTVEGEFREVSRTNPHLVAE